MLNMQRDLLKATGINPNELDPITVYEMAGRIINDPFITIQAQALMLKSKTPGIMKKGTRVKVILSLTETERMALRERIGGIIRLPLSRLGPHNVEVR